MPLSKFEEYAQNLLVLKTFLETKLDLIKNERRKIDLLGDPGKLVNFDKFLKAAEALVKKKSLEESDKSALENIKKFFDERQGESQFSLLEKTIGNRADNPAVELLYFIQGAVFELDPELESVANRDARMSHIAESSNANGTSLQSPEDDAELLRRFEALRESSVTPIQEMQSLITPSVLSAFGVLVEKAIKKAEPFISHDGPNANPALQEKDFLALLETSAIDLNNLSKSNDHEKCFKRIIERLNGVQARFRTTQPDFDALCSNLLQENSSDLETLMEFSRGVKKIAGVLQSPTPVVSQKIASLGAEKTGGKKSIKDKDEFKKIEALFKQRVPDSAPAQKVPPLTLVVTRKPPALPPPPPSNTPVIFMPGYADYVKRLEKISEKKTLRTALTTETALAHLQAAEKKINTMRDLSSEADKKDAFKAQFTKKFPEKIDKWTKAELDESGRDAYIKNHLEHKANTALLHKDYNAEVKDYQNTVDLVIKKNDKDGNLQDCIKESFHKKSQTVAVTVDVFSIENNDLHKAVELALKACPEGGHVRIDDISNPERALKVFLFAKAAGGNDKFRFGTETESQVKEHLQKTDLNEEQQGLKALYEQVVATAPMTPEQIREALMRITQKDIKRLKP